MESVPLHLTRRQMEKLVQGGAVMVSPAMVGGEIECMMHPHRRAKMMKNHGMGKKYRLQMDEDELKGGSFKSFLRKLKKGASKAFSAYKTYVKPQVGPYIRQGLKQGTHAALEIGAAMTGDPEAVALANAIATQLEGLVDWLGDKTGAYGMRSRRRRRIVM